MNREEKEKKKTHVLVLSYPIQGHINPLIQFSKRLASKGCLKVTLLIPTSSPIGLSPDAALSAISVDHIPDGYDPNKTYQAVDDVVKDFFDAVPGYLSEYIKGLANSELPPKVLVYDSTLAWAMDVAHEHGMHATPMFTQPCIVNAVYYLASRGQLEVPAKGPFRLAPSVPVLDVTDLPTMVTDKGYLNPFLKWMVINQFINLEKARWILVNTVQDLEEEAIEWMKTVCSSMTVGPNIPSAYLDQRLEGDKDYGLYLFKPETDACREWLDAREPASVIYVSFGSLASLGEDQMEELAWGIKNTNHHFIWVVRETETNKLPVGFLDEKSGKGLVVPWCSQLKVLAHKAVGCFLTHCGWNSTQEALCLGVPLVTMPQAMDQPTVAKFVEEVWKIGVRVRAGEDGIFTRNAVEGCLREIMEREKGKEIRKNCSKMMELAKRAANTGGSSDKNIDEFVAQVISVS